MKENKKKAIMIVVVVACLVLAGVIIYKTSSESSGGIKSIKHGQMIRVKCNNPACKAEYQMDRKDYLESLQEYQLRLGRQHPSPMGISILPLVCNRCEEESVYKALKCENCEMVFFPGLGERGDFKDRCPECGYSKMEQMKRQTRRGR